MFKIIAQREFPLWCSGLMIWLVSVDARVLPPAWHSGLRIWCCCSCGTGCSSGWDSIPGLGTSIFCGDGWEKKERERERRKSNSLDNHIIWIKKYVNRRVNILAAWSQSSFLVETWVPHLKDRDVVDYHKRCSVLRTADAPLGQIMASTNSQEYLTLFSESMTIWQYPITIWLLK